MEKGLVIKSPASSGASRPGPKWEGRLLTPDQLVAGRYKIIRELGRGGQSSVYLATDETTSQRIALKYAREISSERMAEFAEEESVLRRIITIPGVSKILDARIDLGEIYFALQYAGVQTLKGLYRINDFSWMRARSILMRVANTLEEVHQAGVLHRDVKPSNITISRTGEATLIDFGLAFVMGASTPSQGRIVGTPAYMAPEQARGSDRLDQRIDTYALAVMTYQAAYGVLPFVGTTTMATVMRVLDGQPELDVPFRCSDAPANVRAVIEKGLQKDPKDRFQTAREFAQALEQA